MADLYVWKSKMVKNMQDYAHKDFWSLGIFINWWKNLLIQPLPCEKVAVKIVIFFSQQMTLYFFIVIYFFLYKKANLANFSLAKIEITPLKSRFW